MFSNGKSIFNRLQLMCGLCFSVLCARNQSQIIIPVESELYCSKRIDR